MFKIFIGVDSRQPVAANVLEMSINSQATHPVAICQIRLNQMPISRKGLTEFTYSRYLVPYLCEYKGKALFLDSDMVCMTDINELINLYRHEHAVMVVQSEHRFEWPSLMLFNCAKCKKLTPEYIDDPKSTPQDLSWAEGAIGELPGEWNHLVGYDQPREEVKILHYTMGIPAHSEVTGLGYEAHWQMHYQHMKYTQGWLELMGESVHAEHIFNRIKQQWQQFKSSTTP